MLSKQANYTMIPWIKQGRAGSGLLNSEQKTGQRYRLIAFDMDSTLIQTEVINEMAEAVGVGRQVKSITESAMGGEIDYQQSLKERTALLAGFDIKSMQRMAHTLPLTRGVYHLMGILRWLNIKTAIISGGFLTFGRHLQQKLGFDYVFGNTPEMQNGRLTGRIVGDIVDGPKKAELLKRTAAKEGISIHQTAAVGDGANDLCMMAAAGISVAFNAKPVVREQADLAISGLDLAVLLHLLGLHSSSGRRRINSVLNLKIKEPIKHQKLRRYHV